MSELGQAIIAEIRSLAEEGPDTEAACRYFNDPATKQEPCCIVGNAAHNLGISNRLDEVKPDYEAPFDWNSTGFLELVISDDLDPEEQVWITEVQEQQDGGRTWGAAVGIADELQEIKS